jgi:hypothetical protein
MPDDLCEVGQALGRVIKQSDIISRYEQGAGCRLKHFIFPERNMAVHTCSYQDLPRPTDARCSNPTSMSLHSQLPNTSLGVPDPYASILRGGEDLLKAAARKERNRANAILWA